MKLAFVRRLSAAALLSLFALTSNGCFSDDDQLQQQQQELEVDDEDFDNENNQDLNQVEQEGGDLGAENTLNDNLDGNLSQNQQLEEDFYEQGQIGDLGNENLGLGANVGDDLAGDGQQQGDLEEIIQEINNAPVEGEGFQGSDDLAGNQGTVLDPNLNTEPSANFADAGGPPPAMGSGLPEMNSKMSYVIQKGDTLGEVAQRIYGSREMWREIAEFTKMSNPNRIYPGDVVYYALTEQTMAFATAYENRPLQEVQVDVGDTLSSIAARVLGDSRDWIHLWRQNDSIDDPDQLEVGMRIYYAVPGGMNVVENTENIEVIASEKLASSAGLGLGFELLEGEIVSKKVVTQVKGC